MTTTEIAQAENTGGYEVRRRLPRPVALPACPHWCDMDHGAEFGQDAIPVDDDPVIWGLGHGRHVVVGAANVLIWQADAVWVDGTVVESSAPDLSWEQGERATPAAASDMAAALLATAMLVAAGDGRLSLIGRCLSRAADAIVASTR